MPVPLVDDFLGSARLAGELALDPEVARRWDDESACAGMTVGGLAWHLAEQAHNVVVLTAAEPAPEPPIPLLEHYRRAAWVRGDADDEANVRIRESADGLAAAGAEALAARVRDDLAALPAALESAFDGTRRPDSVLIPWQGWSLSTADFLVTRLMETLVHSDDLAASIGRPTPQFPAGAVREVLALLTGVAVERHGQTAVLRALSRPQRAPGPVSAF